MQKRLTFGLLILIPLGSGGKVFALGSGAFSNEASISARANAMGYAFSGLADDVSAAYYNPAALTSQKGSGLMVGASALDLSSRHTAPSGSTDKSEKDQPVIPYFYASYSKDGSPFAFGLGVNSPFGLITKWKDDSFSKYYATKTELLMYQINPSIAYGVNKNLSVAVGADYINLYDVELNQRIVNLDLSLNPTANDGNGRLEGDGRGWGYNASVFWKSDKHSIGLGYRSQINVIVEGKTTLSNLSGATAFAFTGSPFISGFETRTTTEIKLPQRWLLGYAYKVNDRWVITADYEWAGWSADQEMRFSYDQNNALLPQSIPRKWRDTNNVGIGSEWKATEKVDLRFGFLAFEDVVPSSTLDSTVPDSSRIALTTGAGIHFSDTRVDLGYSAIFFHNRSVTNNAGNTFASMSGKYETMINVVGLSVSHKWGPRKA